jgi:RNA polymerase sigma-70 factor (ECF subfamily)
MLAEMADSRDAPSGVTSHSLLERARGRDAEAWRRLVELYSPLVFFWARRAGLNDADAADLVQEVWQAVASALGRFQRDPDAGTFRGWLWTIARNKVHDHFRARKDGPDAAGGTTAQQLLQSVAETEPSDDTGVEDHRLLHRALEQIRPEFEERTWRAFWRMAGESRTAAEIGKELGMAPNAVHQAKFRVLRRLRQEMAGLVEA